jgi:hypothetical protein
MTCEYAIRKRRFWGHHCQADRPTKSQGPRQCVCGNLTRLTSMRGLWLRKIPFLGQSQISAPKGARHEIEIAGRRVDDWRGSVRFARLYCCPAAFARAGVAVRAVVPFPVAAHQTGHADFRHPAFTRPIRLSLSAGRRGASECGTARACHAGTPAGSARNRDRDLRFASPTSVAADD